MKLRLSVHHSRLFLYSFTIFYKGSFHGNDIYFLPWMFLPSLIVSFMLLLGLYTIIVYSIVYKNNLFVKLIHQPLPPLFRFVSPISPLSFMDLHYTLFLYVGVEKLIPLRFFCLLDTFFSFRYFFV